MYKTWFSWAVGLVAFSWVESLTTTASKRSSSYSYNHKANTGVQTYIALSVQSALQCQIFLDIYTYLRYICSSYKHDNVAAKLTRL